MTDMMMDRNRQDAQMGGPGFLALGTWLEEQQDLQGAIDAYSSAIRFFPGDPIAYRRRGYCYAQIDEEWKAIDDYSSAINLCPTERLSYVGRAVVYFYLEEYSLAQDDVARAIELGPDSPITYYLRGNLNFMCGELDQAVRDYETALSLDPHLKSLRLDRMAAYQASKVWWIFDREGSCLGNVFANEKAPTSAQVGRGDDNPYFEEMVASIQLLGKERVDLEHSVIFLNVELEGVVDRMIARGFTLSTDRTWNPWGWTPWSNESWGC